MNKSIMYGLENGYTYEITRYTNPIPFSNSYLGDYISEVKFKNNIGIILASFRISEFDIIKLLDIFTIFLCEFDTTGKNKVSITLQSLNNKQIIIELSNLSYEQSIKSVDRDMNEYRCYQISIYEADMRDPNQIMQIFKISMGCTEIDEFLFDLYFKTLADVVLDQNTSENLDEILGRIFGSNFFNYE